MKNIIPRTFKEKINNRNFSKSNLMEIIRVMDILDRMSKAMMLINDGVVKYLSQIAEVSEDKAKEYIIIWSCPKREDQ